MTARVKGAVPYVLRFLISGMLPKLEPQQDHRDGDGGPVDRRELVVASRMASTSRRWSLFGRPVGGLEGGSSGVSLAHCSSERAKRIMCQGYHLRRHALGNWSTSAYPRCGELARRMPERKNAFRLSWRSKSHSIRLTSALTRS